ncbi:MAG TPA: hypothetical protein VHO47_02995 [Candidatus Babeliales bacterium]|nr:hypothetical protein [Candidatus Babeliales bacterium]
MVKKKRTLGSNPLEAYLAATTTRSAQKKVESVHEQETESVKKQRITIHLPIDLIDKIKNVVFWEPGLTLTALAQEAFEQAVVKLEKKRGDQYPERKERSLKGGRPLV